MSSVEFAYARLGENEFQATELTRGPWNADHQHAGPPIALLAGALEAAGAKLGMTHMARLTANLLRPIPIDRLRLVVQSDYVGKNIAHLSGSIVLGDKELVRATAILQREVEITLPNELPGHPLAQAPQTSANSPEARFPFARDSLGYPDLVETRVAAGTFFRGPSAVWFRLRHPLVGGQSPSAVQRVAVAADSGNGISAVLPFAHYLFVNSDLTINLLRAARGEWVCIDAQTHVGPSGAALAEGRIFDESGLIGRSTQNLIVRARS